MKKKNVLWIVLTVLICLVICLVLFKFNSQIDGEEYISYRLVSYGNSQKNGEGENANFLLNLDKKKHKIELCVINFDDCNIYKYKEKNNQYSIVSKNKSFIGGSLSLESSNDEKGNQIIKASIKYEDGAKTLLFFRKSDNE